jgi:YHS domain-containing protein
MLINTPPKTPICATCGCSLVRLGVGKDKAAAYRYAGAEHIFCCQACVDVFIADSERLFREYERRVEQIAVCTACLGEIPLEFTVEVEHKGNVFGFCRCPHCRQSFERDPDRLVNRLLW